MIKRQNNRNNSLKVIGIKGECTQLEKPSLRLSFTFLVLYLVARDLGNLHSYKIYLSLKLFALHLVCWHLVSLKASNLSQWSKDDLN